MFASKIMGLMFLAIAVYLALNNGAALANIIKTASAGVVTTTGTLQGAGPGSGIQR